MYVFRTKPEKKLRESFQTQTTQRCFFLLQAQTCSYSIRFDQIKTERDKVLFNKTNCDFKIQIVFWLLEEEWNLIPV